MKTYLKIFYFILLFVFSFSVSFPAQAKPLNNFRSLRLGSRGPGVLLLQQNLQQKGYFPANIVPTSYFGPTTRKAVINFQRANRLPLVGIFGPLTNLALSKLTIQTTPKSAVLSINPTPFPNKIPTPAPVVSPSSVPISPAPIPILSIPQPLLPIVITTKAKTALPLYIYPSPNEKNWETAINAAGNVEFIIANVYNGPGTEIKTNWTNMINKTVSAGVKVYGYVSTNYGKVNGETVDKNISLWFKFYPQISGIFFDEVAADASKIPYYKARYDYVKNINPSLKVVINPGTNTDEGYMSISDVNIIFESSYNSWLAKKIPAWAANYSKERFYAIIYGVPSESEMKEVVKTAKERNFGKMFVTSASGPSSALPSYFQAELAEIFK